MGGKQAEPRWRAICKRNNWYWHKYGDVRYCIHCKTPLPKTENAPDFAVGISFTYVECKNNDKTGRWRWKELSANGNRQNQRTWLLREGGWLFIELGTKNAPKGKSAYLIHFGTWVSEIEPLLLELNMASIRKEPKGKRPGADELLADYRLDWVQNEGWHIPNGHIWWKALYNNLLGLISAYAEQAEVIQQFQL